jgi:protease-4
MMKFDGVFSSGNSTTVVRQHLQAIAASPDVAGVLLRIDSPGGMIAGTQDLANDVAAVAARKPVFSYIEDLGVAAAYWVASAASKVFSNSTAFVGGIGTYATIADSSKMADEKGVRVHVIRAGEFKGVGVPGTKVTDAQLGHLQSIVDAQNEHFINTVARGRKMAIDRARKLADGRTHVGDGARQLGLIDGVGSLDSVLARLRGVAKG